MDDARLIEEFAALKQMAINQDSLQREIRADLRDLRSNMDQYVKKSDLDDFKKDLGKKWSDVASSSDLKSLEKDILRLDSDISNRSVGTNHEIASLKMQLESMKQFNYRLSGALALIAVVAPMVAKLVGVL